MTIPEAFITLAKTQGGGPVSYTDRGSLHISTAGSQPAALLEADFLTLPIKQLLDVADTDNPIDELIAVRPTGTELLPPGIETLIHASLKAPFILHSRHTTVTGVLAGQEGERFVAERFSDRAIWIPLLPPDPTLLSAVRKETARFREDHGGTEPSMIWMQNHGLLITGNTPAEIAGTLNEVIAAVEPLLQRRPNLTPARRDSDALEELNVAVRRALADTRAAHGVALNAPLTTACISPEIAHRNASVTAFEPVRLALMTSQLIHLGHSMCYVPRHGDLTSPQALLADVLHAIHDYYNEETVEPRIVAFEDGGTVIVGEDEEELDRACAAFQLALESACYAESFGGSRGIPASYINVSSRLPVASSKSP